MTLETTPLADFRVTIIPAAQQAKTDALALAGSIVAVTTQQQQTDAIAAASLMKGLLRDVEKARVAVKEPVLEAGRAIDGAAKKYSGELDAEVKRVERLASDWQAEQNRIAAALRAEEERKEREAARLAEEERQREYAALRKMQEQREAEERAEREKIAAAKNAEARAEAEKAAAIARAAREEDARLVAEACREAALARQEAAIERAAAVIAVAPPKAAGASVRVVMDYELKDVRALYAARPDLVELVPKRAMILAAIAIPNQPAIPGLYVFESTKVQSRAS